MKKTVFLVLFSLIIVIASGHKNKKAKDIAKKDEAEPLQKDEAADARAIEYQKRLKAYNERRNNRQYRRRPELQTRRNIITNAGADRGCPQCDRLSQTINKMQNEMASLSHKLSSISNQQAQQAQQLNKHSTELHKISHSVTSYQNQIKLNAEELSRHSDQLMKSSRELSAHDHQVKHYVKQLKDMEVAMNKDKREMEQKMQMVSKHDRMLGDQGKMVQGHDREIKEMSKKMNGNFDDIIKQSRDLKSQTARVSQHMKQLQDYREYIKTALQSRARQHPIDNANAYRNSRRTSEARQRPVTRRYPRNYYYRHDRARTQGDAPAGGPDKEINELVENLTETEAKQIKASELEYAQKHKNHHKKHQHHKKSHIVKLDN